jgi:Tol biopolymer transport system component
MRKAIIIIATLFLFSAAFATAQSGKDLLQQALKKVYEERDFEGAIQIYDQMLHDFASERALMAKVTTGRARAKELAALADARKVYQQVIRDNADQPAVVEEARRRLASSPFPETQPGVFYAKFDQGAATIRGPVTRLTEDWERLEQFPTWSPDSESIAFRRNTATGSAVVIRSVRSGSETVFERRQEVEGPILWLRDGKEILSLRASSGVAPVPEMGPNLARVDLQGNLRELSTIALPMRRNLLALSPDERTLYADVPAGNNNYRTATIVSFDLATGQQKQAFPLPASLNPTTGRNATRGGRYIAISPNGKELAIIRRPGEKDAALALVGVDGENYRVLVDGTGPLEAVTWTSDGSSLVFAKLKPNSGDNWQIMQTPATGGEVVFTGLEVTRLWYFDLSPDGSRIAFDGTGYSLANKVKE